FGIPYATRIAREIKQRILQTTALTASAGVSYNMFLAKIVAVSIADSLLDRRGKLATEHADLLAYAHSEYHALGRKIGTFGFSVRKHR
ncbi:MAG: hypothetical protein IKX30_06315, partial [Victivallales bacterium]|nr:hypothetical protein [Victivallales bacterium]